MDNEEIEENKNPRDSIKKMLGEVDDKSLDTGKIIADSFILCEGVREHARMCSDNVTGAEIALFYTSVHAAACRIEKRIMKSIMKE